MSKINDQIVKYSSAERRINLGLVVTASACFTLCFLLNMAHGRLLDFLSALILVGLGCFILLGAAKVVVHHFLLRPLIQYMRQILLDGDPDPDFDYDKYEEWK